MRKRNYSKLMGIAAATLSAAVIASPMTAHAEGTNENTGVASESGSGASSSESTSSESGSSASSSEGTSSESGSSASSSEGTSSESGSGASSSEGTSSESNASGAASSSTEGTTASATESGASTSASSTEGATTTESTSTTSTGSTSTTSTETTGTAATGTSSTESTGTTTTESTGTATGAGSTETTGTTTTESTGASTATTVAPNGTTTSAPIAAEGNTSANMESTGTTVKAESTSSTTTNPDGSVTETVTTTTTTTEVKDPVFTTTDVKPGTADYDHIQTDADGNPVKDPNGNVIHPITKTEATQGTTTTVSTTTTSTTTKTETTTTTTMTNAEIWDNKNVHTLDNGGNLIDANATLDKDTKDYLNSQNVTADFDVYANTMDKMTCGHIDGNIAVNKLNASTVLMNKEDQYGKTTSISSDKKVDKQYAQNGYSYVGSVAEGVRIETSSNQYDDARHNVSLLVTGSTVTNTDADGTANHFKSVTLTPGATVDGKVTEAAHQEALKQEARLKNLREVSDITNNLADIANKGQKVMESAAAQTGTGTLTSLQKLQKIGALLEQKQLTNQDIITVTIGAAVLSNRNNAGQGDSNDIEAALAKLVSANTQGAHIVLNVVIGDQDVEVSTTGTRVFSVDRHLQNNITDYDARAAYLNWNFGNFTGRINIASTFAGNVIAPSAYLHAGNGLQSGRVVSDTASSGGELHHAVKGQIHEVTVKNVTVVSKQSESKTESTKTTTNSWVSYTYPTFPTTPETPETPETPKTPETPETPKTPETPETPKTPETPETPKTSETPSHHESHDDDDHDDPSRDIQYFTEDPHVLGVSRDREIPISYMPFIEEGHVLGESRPKTPVENVLGVNRSVQTGDAGHMNAYAIASILSILTLAGWAVSYKER